MTDSEPVLFSALGMHLVVYSYLEDLVCEGMAPREGQIIIQVARAELNSCGKDRHGDKFALKYSWKRMLESNLSLQERLGMDARCCL